MWPSALAAEIIARNRWRPSVCWSASLAGLNGVSGGGGNNGTEALAAGDAAVLPA